MRKYRYNLLYSREMCGFLDFTGYFELKIIRKGYKMQNSGLIFLVALMTVAGFGFAAALNPSHVPAEAKWVVHSDFDSFRRSELWSLIEVEIREDHQQKLDEIEEVFGSDLMQDVYGVTLFGKDSGEENAVILIYGRYDQEKLVSLLEMNDAYESKEYARKKLHFWVDEDDHKDKVGAFAGERLIVMSQREEPVRAMLDLLSGKEQTLAQVNEGPLAGLAQAPAGAFMVMAAEDLAQLSKKDKNAAIFHKSNMMAVVAGENENDVYMYADLTAENELAAQQIEQVLYGIQAFAALKNTRNPEMVSFINSIKLERNANQLYLTLRSPAMTVFKILEAKTSWWKKHQKDSDEK